MLQSPGDLYERLAKGVIDQDEALQQVSVALYKHVNRLKAGNIMLVGNSGSGKTTIMRNVERVFGEDEKLSRFTNTIRLNANVVADDESSDLESSVILERLRQNALSIMGKQATVERFKDLMENGVVFLDEVDKIRGHVGERTNARGLMAQESLLTLIEGEGVNLLLAVRDSEGILHEETVHIDTGRILFICGGAFEGLYDMVYRRVASGEHKDKLVQEYVVDDHQDDLQEKEHFSLKNYVRYEDMFTYGMTPQFLGRFDEIIVLNDLTVNGLMRIFVEPVDAPFRESRRYFQTLGVDLQISREGLRALAEHAHQNHRLGARALKTVFKRVLRGVEFNPTESWLAKDKDGRKQITVTRDLVDRNA